MGTVHVPITAMDKHIGLTKSQAQSGKHFPLFLSFSDKAPLLRATPGYENSVS